MLRIVGGVHPLAIHFSGDVSGKAHGPAFFTNRISAGFGIDRDQQSRIFNLAAELERPRYWEARIQSGLEGQH